jgi:hypothetical protein
MMKSNVQVSGVVCSALKGCMQLLEVPREWPRLATPSIYNPISKKSRYPLEPASARAPDTVVVAPGGAPNNLIQWLV